MELVKRITFNQNLRIKKKILTNLYISRIGNVIELLLVYLLFSGPPDPKILNCQAQLQNPSPKSKSKVQRKILVLLIWAFQD